MVRAAWNLIDEPVILTTANGTALQNDPLVRATPLDGVAELSQGMLNDHA